MFRVAVVHERVQQRYAVITRILLASIRRKQLHEAPLFAFARHPLQKDLLPVREPFSVQSILGLYKIVRTVAGKKSSAYNCIDVILRR